MQILKAATAPRPFPIPHSLHFPFPVSASPPLSISCSPWCLLYSLALLLLPLWLSHLSLSLTKSQPWKPFATLMANAACCLAHRNSPSSVGVRCSSEASWCRGCCSVYSVTMESGRGRNRGGVVGSGLEDDRCGRGGFLRTGTKSTRRSKICVLVCPCHEFDCCPWYPSLSAAKCTSPLPISGGVVTARCVQTPSGPRENRWCT